MQHQKKAYKDIVQTLIDAKADVNAKDKHGNTALIAAVNSKSNEIVQALLNAGANVNAKNDNGYTALMEAAINHNCEIIQTLISLGADINLKDNSGNRALNFAKNNYARAETGNKPESIRILKEAGAKEATCCLS